MISFYSYFTLRKKKSNMESHTLFKPSDCLTLMPIPGPLASPTLVKSIGSRGSPNFR